MNAGITAPAQIIIGPHAGTVAYTEQLLQKLFCTHNGCLSCVTCKSIVARQHAALAWLSPAHYRTATIGIVQETMRYVRPTDSPFFFVLPYAEQLNNTCANRLLKSIEEPLPGYHFILLAERPELLLATLRSRCVTVTLPANEVAPLPELLTYFTQPHKKNCPADFLKELEKMNLDEHESGRLFDMLVHHWTATLQKTDERLLTFLQTTLLQKPMAGSSNLFWKNLYVQTAEF